MHGRMRKEKPPSREEVEADRKKAEMYQQLLSITLSCREKKEKNEENSNGNSRKGELEEVLQLTSKVLRNNPDVYSVWNQRREILIFMHSNLGLSEEKPREEKRKIVQSTESIKKLVAEELSLSTDAIKRNSKSYGAWYHRVWIVDRFAVDIDSELALCQEFLKFDQRNFHCWNYRRHIVEVAGVSPQAEFDFSSKKIEENFSNYSALHHRSVYLKPLIQATESQEARQSIFETEFSIVENAVFTEPDDQSAWWYYHFLLKSASPIFSLELDWLQEELQRQLDTLNSLLEVEPSSKWCMLAKVFLISELLKTKAQKSENEDNSLLVQNRLDTIDILTEIDPGHVNRYHYMKKQNIIIPEQAAA